MNDTFYFQKITSTVEMKDTSSDSVQVVYYSSCLNGKELAQTNKCDGLKVIFFYNLMISLPLFITNILILKMYCRLVMWWSLQLKLH